MTIYALNHTMKSHLVLTKGHIASIIRTCKFISLHKTNVLPLYLEHWEHFRGVVFVLCCGLFLSDQNAKEVGCKLCWYFNHFKVNWIRRCKAWSIAIRWIRNNREESTLYFKNGVAPHRVQYRGIHI